jgi:Fusaric acid resistance protein family.
MTWYFTGWGEGPLMLMATSIMVSIFSTHDRPAVMLNHIFAGASLGVAAALFCRLVLLPGLSTLLLQAIICVPVLMICILALNHHRTARGAMDAMLFFLFVLQPGLPGVPAPAAFVAGGCAALGGIGVAIFLFDSCCRSIQAGAYARSCSPLSLICAEWRRLIHFRL